MRVLHKTARLSWFIIQPSTFWVTVKETIEQNVLSNSWFCFLIGQCVGGSPAVSYWGGSAGERSHNCDTDSVAVRGS